MKFCQKKSKTCRADEIRHIRLDEKSVYCDNTVVNSKYTVITFLPLNFFEQFCRPINFYFLIVAVLQFIPSITPVSPLSTVGPLLVAFSITAAKEGYDDLMRHQQDKKDNNRTYRKLDSLGKAVDVVCSEIQVGDLLILGPYDMLPCDAIGLLSSSGDGSIYVSTENLDGESDAKEKIAALSDDWRQKRKLDIATARTEVLSIDEAAAHIASHQFRVDSEGPNKDLTKFTGSLHFTDEDQPVGLCIDQFLPASSVVRNTHFVVALAVFTGNETKVGMTKRYPPTKWALLDQQCTKFAKFVFGFQFLIVVSVSIVGGLVTKSAEQSHWYLLYENDQPSTLFYLVILPLRFFLMATLMVPISFKVTVDISKAYVAKVIQWDLGAYDAKRNSFCKVNNSALAEDLGQIECVLTDKTGTLTENEMKFRCLMSRDGYVRSSEEGTLDGFASSCSIYDRRLLEALALCNTVERVAQNKAEDLSSMVEHSETWTSPSPDEIALVSGAAQCGVVLMDRTRQLATVRIEDSEQAYQVLHVIKFSSARGKMSVIVQPPEGPLLLFMKGSDERVLPLCDESCDRFQINKRLLEFASQGLRTLVFAYRELTGDQYSNWIRRMQAAEAEMDSLRRTALVGSLCEEVEASLIFLGATAVEDKLQEGVKDTISKLRQAGVKVWMLTGDKLETAKQIALTSGLLNAADNTFEFIVPDGVSDAAAIAVIERELLDLAGRKVNRQPHGHNTTMTDISREFARQNEVSSSFLESVVKAGARRHSFKEGSSKSMKSEETLGLLQKGSESLLPVSEFSIVINGRALQVLQHPTNDSLMDSFAEVLLSAATVICCRTTPDQKAFVAHTVRGKGRMTLAIGDGGNDVAMIQEAHVGVGVEGVEGKQAAKAADFAVARFRFLLRLMLVHGHTAFQRTSYIVQQSFYKSMMIAWVQVLYNTQTLLSGVSFYNSFALMMWNGVFTIPLTFLYVTDVQLQPNTLEAIPSLYQLSQKARYLNATTFFGFIARGIVQGTVGFYLTCAILGPDMSLSDGTTTDYQTQFLAPYAGAVLLVTLTVLLESHSFFFLQWLAVIGCPAALVLSFFIYSNEFTTLDFYGAFTVMLRSAGFALTVFAATACCFLPHCFYGGLKFWVWPSRLQLQRGFLKRVAQLPFHSILKEQFPQDNPSAFWRSLVPLGWCDEVDIPPSYSTKESVISAL